MNGEKLYAIYADCQLALNNCEVDKWEDLPYQERLVWDSTACCVRGGT